MTVANEKNHQKSSGDRTKFALLLICTVLIFLISLSIGRYNIPISDIVKILLSTFTNIHHDWAPTMSTVVLQVRLPRLIIVSLVGAALALSGASFQAILKNPLVSSDILGVSAGAGFGAAIALYLNLDSIAVQILAIIFGMAAVGMAYAIYTLTKKSSTLILVLSGIIIGSFFSALVSLMKFLANQSASNNASFTAIVFWLLGSFSNASSYTYVAEFGIPIMIGMVVLLLLRWRINVLSLEDNEAKALGINVKRYQGIIILFSTLITASAVSVAGLVGWVGLFVPHIARMLVGSNNGKVLPVSILIGISFLVVIDDIARTLTPYEIPIGILTATIGLPIFAYLLIRQRVGWS
jgi:iron complex transport system permease protein